MSSLTNSLAARKTSRSFGRRAYGSHRISDPVYGSDCAYTDAFGHTSPEFLLHQLGVEPIDGDGMPGYAVWTSSKSHNCGEDLVRSTWGSRDLGR